MPVNLTGNGYVAQLSQSNGLPFPCNLFRNGVLGVTARLGIMGGGQLALFLCQAGQALGAEVAVIADAVDAPALEIADSPFRGSLHDMSALNQFLDHCDVVTFDKEAIPDEALRHLVGAEEQGRCVVLPRVDTLLLLNDKSLQKKWLVQQQLPTLPFVALSGNNTSVSSLKAKLGSSVVQKACSGGYDGRGVQMLAPITASQQLWNIPSIVEPYLLGCREIAVIVARSPSGEIDIFPPVSMCFDAQLNSVKTVTIPAAIGDEKTAEAKELARRTIEVLGGIGVFAVEMFITAEEELLINEISPRVHNSGHVTLDACNVSQFEQHARAVLDLPLVPSCLASPAAMINILYREDYRAICPPAPAVEILPESGATVYWYGKTAGHAGRKMGHINALGRNVAEALGNGESAMMKLHSKGKAA